MYRKMKDINKQKSEKKAKSRSKWLMYLIFQFQTDGLALRENERRVVFRKKRTLKQTEILLFYHVTSVRQDKHCWHTCFHMYLLCQKGSKCSLSLTRRPPWDLWLLRGKVAWINKTCRHQRNTDLKTGLGRSMKMELYGYICQVMRHSAF